MKTLVEYSEIINAVENCQAEATNAIPVGKDAALVVFDFGGCQTTSAVIYEDGTVFTPWDWQSGEYAQTVDEINDYKWREGVSEEVAIMVDGLPRTF